MVHSHEIYYPLYNNKDKFIILITGGRGCEDPNTPIMMADLTVKPIKDIKVGDKVMGDDGKPRLVLNTVHGYGPMYRVHQKNAEDYTVNDTHILSVKKRPSAMESYGKNAKGQPKCPNGRYPQYAEYSDIPIMEYLSKSDRFRQNFSGYKSGSIAYPSQEVAIPPYVLGVWLGDGTAMYPRVTNPEEEVADELQRYCDSIGVVLTKSWHDGAWHMGLVMGGGKGHGNTGGNAFLNGLKGYGLINNKHIPQSYISNSEECRLELLAGLIDTDGSYDSRGGYEIVQKNESLAKQIKFIADTLGFRTHISSRVASIGEKKYGLYYRVQISGDIHRIPCRVARKKASDIHYKNRSWLVSVLDIEKVTDYGEWCGIQIDGNQRYLHSDGTVTHNSGKSFSASTFIERLTFEVGETEGKKIAHQILYTRYTMVSANISVIPEFMEKIEADETERFFARSKGDIVNRMTGGTVMFRGIKTSSGNQTAKLKSIHGLTTFVVDEGEEWTSEKEFETIMFSIRQAGLQNRIIIIMNPTDSNHFIYQKYIKDTHKIVEYDGVPVQISTHPNVLHIHTTYLDNLKYLGEQFLKEAKAMKENNPERYAHLFMGRWADVKEGAIFKKWGIVDEFPEHAKHVCRGLDFGYSMDPSACVKIGIVGNDLYLDEQFYAVGMLSTDIIRELKKEKGFVYADSADPRLIDEIALGGIIIYAVMKGGGSINAGIDKMLTFDNIFVTKRSVNLQEEMRNYTWAKDKDGNFINEPIDAYNHCFVADTKVLTKEGEKDIIDVKVGDMVLTSNGYRRVTRFFDNGYKNTYRTTIDYRVDGKVYHTFFEATTNHKIKTARGWVELNDLMHTDKIYVLDPTNRTENHILVESQIDRIVKDGGYSHVYDIEVEGEHEFFANGVLVHNCIDAGRYAILGHILGKILKTKNTKTKSELGLY